LRASQQATPFHGASALSQTQAVDRVPCNRVLLVEDNADDEAMTLRALRRVCEPLEAHVARDGQESLDLLEDLVAKSSLPAVILLDLKLPKVDGIRVLERVRSSPATADIPVVVFTSSDEPSDIERCRALGATEFVSKPIDYGAFQDAVERLARTWLAA
jgi:CheY-like chemotaxis protein